MPLISLSCISLRPQVAGSPMRALDSVSLTVGEGDYIAVSGPSGSGKSALLNMLSLLELPDSGELHWRGQLLNHSGEAVKRQIRLAHIGYILQRCQLIERYTVFQNVELGLSAASVTPAERRERIAALLEQLDLLSLAHCLPSQLSMGQQQCVAIARAVIAQPALLLADDPGAHLDARQKRHMLRLLDTLNSNGSAIVMVSQDTAQTGRAGRTLDMADGRIASDVIHRP